MPDEKVLAWLKARARVTDAEEQLSDMFDKAERLLRSLRDQPSTPFDANSWPGSAVAAALRECREAQRAFDQANAVLSPADPKLLKSIPTDF
jgi:tetratricopeptide (TPR) repeat protein